MSATENQELDTNTEPAARPVLFRAFDASSVEVEGRMVDVRVVPFGEAATVADPPDFRRYQEEWLPGVFDHQLNAANRLHANYEHERGISNVVGHGVSLRAESDGYHATFKIHQTQAGDTTLELLNDGALPGVSLEAIAKRSIRSATGVIQRVKADLRGMAFCRTPAFAGAQVLAVREADEEEEIVTDEAFMPKPLDPELIERCKRLGIALPQRYQAQPESTDTPVETGTSEDGTRQSPEITDSQE